MFNLIQKLLFQSLRITFVSTFSLICVERYIDPFCFLDWRGVTKWNVCIDHHALTAKYHWTTRRLDRINGNVKLDYRWKWILSIRAKQALTPYLSPRESPVSSKFNIFFSMSDEIGFTEITTMKKYLPWPKQILWLSLDGYWGHFTQNWGGKHFKILSFNSISILIT